MKLNKNIYTYFGTVNLRHDDLQ